MQANPKVAARLNARFAARTTAEAAPAVPAPSADHVIVCRGGVWGRGRTLTEALAVVPFPGSFKLPCEAIVYPCDAEGHIGDDGRIYRRAGKGAQRGTLRRVKGEVVLSKAVEL